MNFLLPVSLHLTYERHTRDCVIIDGNCNILYLVIIIESRWSVSRVGLSLECGYDSVRCVAGRVLTLVYLPLYQDWDFIDETM